MTGITGCQEKTLAWLALDNLRELNTKLCERVLNQEYLAAASFDGGKSER